ncbi:PAS domain S-box protein [Sphingosinicella sp. BN140058]|uniref:PAS domain-containing sensor histidine kinase n=1 Tax=Sphingosinicella sp. BN140058 TaxID=1892855 RepID=UPI0010118730|nr:PAS domain S-box protein [Sphingosinicella sp. BN140058]QAY75771.1 PAS domain S-box protein [Sphingosinicella sp. BN140058]
MLSDFVPDRRTRLIIVYLTAAAAVGAAFVVRSGLGEILRDRSPFLLFVLPVVFAVLLGGRGPGLLSGFLSLAAGFSFVDAAHRSQPAMLVEGLLFVLVCAGVGWIGGRLGEQKRLAEAHRISAEAEAQRARAAGEELRLLLEGATRYAIFMVDPEGNVLNWNSGAERLFGWRQEDVIGRHCSIFVSQDEPRSRATAELETARNAGRFSEEGWYVRADGSEFLADAMITPLESQGGRLTGYAKIIHDVTDRRAAERTLKRREQHLQSILATVPDAMIVIDDKGLMISFSAAAEKLFGYEEAEVVGKNVSMLMPSPDRERHDAYIERYLATLEPHIIGIGRIVTGLRADGSTFPMKLSVGEALTEDQRLFTGFVQDLTERKDFEARLEQLKSELIHVSRLSAMGTMASTLAHELNQPLTAIATYGEAAGDLLAGSDTADKELLREVFGEMAGQAIRAGTIVRRLREFVARGDVSKTVEDLPKLISEASALALVGSKEKGVTAHFVYAPDASPVLVDRVQIQQVLINLMRNGIEAMDDRPVRRLTIETSLLDPETVQVTVSDTGSGLAPEVAENLFQAFTSTKEAGMGLGLSICRTIIEAHGGRIRARAAEGGGTQFLFTLVRPPSLEPEGETTE